MDPNRCKFCGWNFLIAWKNKKERKKNVFISIKKNSIKIKVVSLFEFENVPLLSYNCRYITKIMQTQWRVVQVYCTQRNQISVRISYHIDCLAYLCTTFWKLFNDFCFHWYSLAKTLRCTLTHSERRPQNRYSQEEMNLYCIIKLATDISLFSLQISKTWCFG